MGISADKISHTNAAVQSSLNRYKDCRKRGDLLQAENWLRKAEAKLEELGRDYLHSTWSRFLYENAYFSRINGEYGNASTLFLESGEYAKRADDPLRNLIGGYMSTLTEFYGASLGANPCFGLLYEIDRKISAFSSERHRYPGLFENAQYNSTKTLADLGFECEKPEFIELAERVCRNEAHYVNVRQGGNLFCLYDAQMKTRIKMTQQDFVSAARLFASYLAAEENQLLEILGAELDHDLITLLDGWMEEMAREYRDFGISIRRSGIQDADKFAQLIWRKGLEYPVGHSNKLYRQQIEKMLKSTEH